MSGISTYLVWLVPAIVTIGGGLAWLAFRHPDRFKSFIGVPALICCALGFAALAAFTTGTLWADSNSLVKWVANINCSDFGMDVLELLADDIRALIFWQYIGTIGIASLAAFFIALMYLSGSFKDR
jgi:hypothetical protein